MKSGIERKPETEAIAAYMTSLPDKHRVSDGRAEWSRFLFHTTDIRNIASILQTGALMSRQRALDRGLLVHDSAHPEIVDRTREPYKNCVRLYFRPRTPTHYRTEGFRPPERRKETHHGIPVVLVFDAVELLTRRNVRFTDGNAGHADCRDGDDLAFLESIPFELVYHDSAVPTEVKNQIIFRRNAEVLIPDELILEGALCWGFLRSEAEYETLEYYLRDLNDQIRHQYTRAFVLNSATQRARQLFHRKWTYVETAQVAEGHLTIRFSKESETPGPFSLRLRILSDDETVTLIDHFEAFTVTKRPFVRRLPLQCSEEPFVVELWLDDDIAYWNRFMPSDSLLIPPV